MDQLDIMLQAFDVAWGGGNPQETGADTVAIQAFTQDQLIQCIDGTRSM